MVFRTDSAASLELVQRSNPDRANPMQNFLMGLVLGRTASHGRMRLMLGDWLRSRFDSHERLKSAAATRPLAASAGAGEGSGDAEPDLEEQAPARWQPSLADHEYLRSMVGAPQPRPRALPGSIQDGKQADRSNTASDDSIEGSSDTGSGASSPTSSAHALPAVESTPLTLAALSPGSQPPSPLQRGASTPSEASAAQQPRAAAASAPVSPFAPASSPQLPSRAYTAPTDFKDPRPVAELPPPTPSTRLTSCGECGACIEGSVFMLNDRGYCCQRHRLAAYHKSERARMRTGHAVADAERREPVGLLATYPAWC